MEPPPFVDDGHLARMPGRERVGQRGPGRPTTHSTRTSPGTYAGTAASRIEASVADRKTGGTKKGCRVGGGLVGAAGAARLRTQPVPHPEPTQAPRQAA